MAKGKLGKSAKPTSWILTFVGKERHDMGASVGRRERLGILTQRKEKSWTRLHRVRMTPSQACFSLKSWFSESFGRGLEDLSFLTTD